MTDTSVTVLLRNIVEVNFMCISYNFMLRYLSIFFTFFIIW